ncbi:class I SAM-dependent methyltransferase [bacterium]|nr:class I SAM-dependent methyltransferase [bacterium]
MLENLKEGSFHGERLIDVGCGYADLLRHIQTEEIPLKYIGVDISNKFIEFCKLQYPAQEFHCCDLLEDELPIERAEYVVLNGVFTIKNKLSFDEMFEFVQLMLAKCWTYTDVAMSFNVMSTHVDWERDDLFHCPIDKLVDFLTKNISLDVLIRADYKLYEYTVKVYRRAE